jgi:hypothetical protein
MVPYGKIADFIRVYTRVRVWCVRTLTPWSHFFFTDSPFPVTCTRYHFSCLEDGFFKMRGIGGQFISIGVGDEWGWMTEEALNGGVFYWKGV